MKTNLRGTFGWKEDFGTEMPYAYITVRHESEETTPCQALMDTGAGVILIVMDYATEMLNMSEGEIAESLSGKPWPETQTSRP